jgi:MFS family permease
VRETGADSPARARLLGVMMYGLVLACSSLQWAVVPILPAYSHRFGLSGPEQGVLLGATGLATLAVSLPAGVLSDRFGARKLTLRACGLMTAAVLIQAVAPSFPVLLASRLAFGMGYGVLWTAGLSWLAAGISGASGLGGSVAMSGAGTIAGPALFGAGVQYFGLATPFLASGVVLALITAALGLLRLPAPSPAAPAPIGASLRATVADPGTISATAAIILAGVTSGVSSLVVPDEMHAAGASPGKIGLAFSVAAVFFVVGSVVTTSAGARAVRVTVVAAAMLALALGLSPAALSSAPTAIVVMLCTTAAARSVLWAVSYPLGAIGAERSGVGIGVAMALLNGVWAATAVVSPLLAGVAVQRLSPRGVFGLTEAVCIAILACVIVVARRSRPHGWFSRDSGLHPEQLLPADGTAIRSSGRRRAGSGDDRNEMDPS